MDQGCNDSRQRIVVAELDLIGNNRIVLIDDGDHAHGQQLGKCCSRIPSVLIVDHRKLRDQHLRRHLVVLREQPLVNHHQTGLSDGSTGLLHRLFLRPLGDLHGLSSHGNRTGRH